MLTVGTIAPVVTWRRCRAVGIVLLVATFSRPLLEFTIKALVDRERPDLDRLVAGTGAVVPQRARDGCGRHLWGVLPLVVLALHPPPRRLVGVGRRLRRPDRRHHRQPGVPRRPLVLRRHRRPGGGHVLPAGGRDLLTRQHALPLGGLLDAVTGRWSDSDENGNAPGADTSGTDAPVTVAAGDTYT